MNKFPYFSRSYLMLIALGGLLVLTSCKELAQSNIPPAVEEVSAPSGFDPGMELTSKYLFCPIIPNTSPFIPAGPYDEDLGDCTLRGKSTEIEAWLTVLEQIAASCQANREPNWTAALAARDYLDSKIDELEVTEVVETITPQPRDEDDIYMDTVEESDESCPTYPAPEADHSDNGEFPPDTHHYTNWLMSIGENVGKYCTMIDEIVKPLWQACDKINFYQDCQEPNAEVYHAIIESMMNAAQANYDYTDFFYTHTLQTTGWGNFRLAFNETSIDCPLDPQAPNTKFAFLMNTFCRRGPSSEYEKVATFLEGQGVQIDGKNQSEPRWWWVLIPDSSEHCWVSDSTGSAAGFLEDLEIVAAPPLSIIPACSKDLGESACLAAGGTWVKKDVPGGIYCDCK